MRTGRLAAAFATAAITLGASGGAFASSLISVDFNSLEHGDIVTDQFDVFGVTFSLLGSSPIEGPTAYALKDGSIANTGDPVDIFGANGLAIIPGVVQEEPCDGPCISPFFDIEMSFSDPIDYFSIMALDAEESFVIYAYLGDTQVASIDQTTATLLGNFSSSVFNGPVYNPTLGEIGGGILFDRVVIDVSGGGPEEWDNLMFNVVAVPVPSTLSLFLFGLAGLGFIGWRRRQVA